MQKCKAKKEVVEQVTSKLPASKNIFQRGDFDEYKISDEELKECTNFIEKSHKYINKIIKGNKTIYIYEKDLKKAVRKVKFCNSKLLPCDINNAKKEGEKYLFQWAKDWNPGFHCETLNNQKVMLDVGYKKKQKRYGISIFHLSHKGKQFGEKKRSPQDIYDRAKLLPIAKEILTDKNKGIITETRVTKNKIEYSVCGKVMINKKVQVVCVVVSRILPNNGIYISTINKAMFENSNIAIISEVYLVNPKTLTNQQRLNLGLSELPAHTDKAVEKSTKGISGKLRNSIYDKIPKHNIIIPNSKNKSICKLNNVQKSLTFSGWKLQGRTKLYGMDISIENKKGSYRKGTDKDGHNWKTLMNFDYGYIRGTVGTDKDHLDCYIGPDKEAQKVYVIHQNDPVTHKYDEDKCMLCFSSAEEAKKGYMKQYDRPGFFGSMETLSIDEFKSFIFSHKGKRVHKSFDIQITDITENNKQQKVEQVEKALLNIAENKPFAIKHIPADNSRKYSDITLRINNFDRSKIQKAVHEMAFTLDTKIKSSKGEAFNYKSQEELTDRIVDEFTEATKDVYSWLIAYFGLPEVRIIAKADMNYKGKVIYNPETGKPLTKAEWEQFTKAFERLLNTKYSNMGKKIILSSETLGKLLKKLSEVNSFEKVQKFALRDMDYNKHSFEWISESVKNMQNAFNEQLSRDRQARVQVAIDCAGQRIVKITDDMRNNINTIIMEGVRDKKSKAQISQELFKQCSSINRDFQRIADTEIQNNTNLSYINEQVYNSKPGEKVYFQRIEMLDDITCKKCRSLNGTIALFSDISLADEYIEDEFASVAIWEGKLTGDVPMNNPHPYCRGSWVRYSPKHKYF